MLYVIHCANHPDLPIGAGRSRSSIWKPICTQSCMGGSEWAAVGVHPVECGRVLYGVPFADSTSLTRSIGTAVAATDFRPADVKEGKQAEFLVEHSFPWHLVERIGVHSQAIAQQVSNAMQGAAHRPPIEIRRDWYY